MRMVLAKGAENNQSTGEQSAEGDELTTLGFEKIEKVAWFHGWPLGVRIGRTGALVVVTTGGGGGGGDSRLIKTVNSFFRDRLFRPPSGVPVTAK